MVKCPSCNFELAPHPKVVQEFKLNTPYICFCQLCKSNVLVVDKRTLFGYKTKILAVNKDFNPLSVIRALEE